MTKLPGLMGAARAALLLLALLASAVGAFAGIVFWAWQGSLIGVVVSALVPGTCAIAVLTRQSARLRPSGD